MPDSKVRPASNRYLVDFDGKLGFEHTLEKALRCGLVARLLEQDIQFGTVFVDPPPQQPALATPVYALASRDVPTFTKHS
ncbi:hypothetical protein NCPPB3923_23655 [Burkholderia glumae]|nr:hypothetical protein NCPPB3923_23655 [Burkholderia glumae]